MPKIEIAIAVYNDAEYLRHTLAALEAQTFRDFHVTLLDDGSTDDSLRVAEAFAARLPMRIIAAAHRGRQVTKAALAELVLDCAPHVLFLDSDIEPPPDALARLLAALEADASIGAVSSRCRSPARRPLGAGQAFLDDLFFESKRDASGRVFWIFGGCALYRSHILKGLPRRADVTEDDDIAAKLSPQWKFPALDDCIAIHYGVPTTLAGLLRRGEREGVRVCALLRVYSSGRNFGNVVRLFPLPIALAGVGGALTLQPWLLAGSASLLAGYVAAFMLASRRVPGTLGDRLAGALDFTFMNLGFGYGYLRERLRGNPAALHEPDRAR